MRRAMLFPTVAFAIFFVVVLCISWLLMPRPVVWRLFIIGASWFFYGWWDARFVALLAGSTLGNYFFGVAVWRSLRPTVDAGPVEVVDASPRERGPWTSWALAAGIGMNLALLGWFKYYEFFSTSLTNSLADVGIDAPFPLLEVTLPIGISFFTFQAISYLVDISRCQIRPMYPLDFAAYLSFFPHLVAGPIVRASEFGPQLQRPADPNRVPVTEALTLIAAGLFKKVVVSTYLATEIVDPVFALPDQHSSLEIWVATYAYAVQIYADFSGYTDIAIGCALLLGFRFPQNFDEPYRAFSVQDFWRRWHMTLSRWLRDYVYIPLGGNRGASLFIARNLLLTMLLGGLWHGAAWTFVVWGGIHGGWMVIERFAIGEDRQGRWLPAVRWIVTFNVVCLAWIFFRAESVDVAFDMLGRLFSDWGGASPLVTPLVVATVAGMIALQFVPSGWYRDLRVRLSHVPAVAQAVLFACALVMVDALGPAGVAPFIYFQF